MKKKYQCQKKRVLFCLLDGTNVLVFVRSIKPDPQKGRYLDIIDISTFLREKFSELLDRQKCEAFIEAMPSMKEEIGIFYKNDDTNHPMIDKRDLEKWFRRTKLVISV